MSRWIAARRLIVATGLTFVVAACTGARASVAPTGAPSAAPATSSPGIPVAEPSATPDGPAPSLGEPPEATLAADGGDPVAGALGSFTWGDGGSDSPWLPGAPIAVASGEPLTVGLAVGVPVRDWTATRVPAGTSDGAGSVAIAAGKATPIAFPAPGPGTWSVQVAATFGDGLGSAAYYWAVTVR